MDTLNSEVARLCFTILDGHKESILLLADKLQDLRHPNAGQVREIYCNAYYSGPRDESLAVLLALPDELGWQLACDFAEHFNQVSQPAQSTEVSPHYQIIRACREWRAGRLSQKAFTDLLEKAPRYYQYWGKAKDGNEAACNALGGILAFSATGGKEPAWQHQRIRESILAICHT